MIVEGTTIRRLGPAASGQRHDLDCCPDQTCPLLAMPVVDLPRLRRIARKGEYGWNFLAVIIQGGIMPQIQPLFPSVIDFLQ